VLARMHQKCRIKPKGESIAKIMVLKESLNSLISLPPMDFTSLVKPVVNSECALTPACGAAEETLCAIARNQRNEFEY
jgi:hypothetical protein